MEAASKIFADLVLRRFNGEEIPETPPPARPPLPEWYVIDPCPFCGGEADSIPRRLFLKIQCTQCKATGPDVLPKDGVDEELEWGSRCSKATIEAWNRRTTGATNGN